MQHQLKQQSQPWQQKLREKPQWFQEVEAEVAEEFLQRSGFFVTALLVMATAQQPFVEQVRTATEEFSQPLGKARKQTIMVRFLTLTKLKKQK